MATEAEKKALLEQIKKLKDEIFEVEKKSTVDLKEKIKLNRKILEIEAEVLGTYKDLAEREKNLTALRETRRAIDQDVLDLKAKQADEALKATVEARKEFELAKQQKGLGDDRVKKLKKQLDLRQQDYATLIKQIKLLEKRQELEDKADAALGSIKDHTSEILEAVTGIGNKWEQTIMGKFEAASKSTGGMELALSKVGDQMKTQFGAGNLMNNMLMKVQESTITVAKNVDSERAAFNKATGAGGKHDQVMQDVYKSNLSVGISYGEVSGAAQALYTQMSDFSELSKETQKDMIELTAQFERLGIASGTSAANMQSLTKALQMTAPQAADAMKKINATAAALNMSMGQLQQDFQQALPTLAVYGDRAVEVFQRLAGAAKATGLAVSDLTGIAEQFDTFEGAATAVGKLNAAMGLQLDMHEMMMADEEERIRIILQRMDAQGKDFASMGKFEQKTIAAAIGIRDMDKANRLLGKGLAGYDEMTSKAGQAAMSQEELKKRADEAKSATEAMQRMMESFSIAVQPVVDGINKFLTAITKINDAIGGWLIPTLVVLMGIYKMYIMYQTISTMRSMKNAAAKIIEAAAEGGVNTVKSASVPINAAKATSETTLAGAQGVQSAATVVQGKAAAAATPPIVAFGTAILKIGVGIGLAVGSLALLAYSFSLLSVEQMIGFIVALAMFAVVILVVNKAVTAALPGIGIMLVFFGGLSLLFLALGFGLKMAGEGFSAMGTGIVQTAKNGLAAASALASLSASLFGLGFAMIFVSQDKLDAFATMFEGIGNMGDAAAATVANLGQTIREMGNAIDDLDESKTIAFAAVVSGFGAIAGGLTKGKAEVDASKTLFGAGATGDRMAATAAAGAGAAATPAGPAVAPEITLNATFKLEGRELGKFVKKTVDGDPDFTARIGGA
jgi:hypothetical protein